MSFGEAFFILLAERGVMPKEGLWMVANHLPRVGPCIPVCPGVSEGEQ
jgi:hypothetical protein